MFHSILCQLIPVNVGKLLVGSRCLYIVMNQKRLKTNNQPVKCCVHAKFAFIKVPKAALIGGGKETSPVKPRRPCAEMHPVRGSAVGQLKAAACPLLVPPQKGHCMIYAPVWWAGWRVFVLWGTWPIKTWNMKMKFCSWIDLQGWAGTYVPDGEWRDKYVHALWSCPYAERRRCFVLCAGKKKKLLQRCLLPAAAREKKNV